MFQFFNRNTIITYIALPVVLVILRLRLILYPQQILTATDADLYTPIWRSVLGSIAEGSTLSVALALLFTLIATYIVNNIFNSYHFADRQSGIAGLFYILYSSGFVVSQGLHPVHVFSIFLLLAIWCLFYGATTERPMLACYNGAAFVSLGWLFWGKGAWFVICFFIIQIILRKGDSRSIIASLLGLITPLIFVASYYYCQGSIHDTCNMFWRNTIAPVAFYRTGLYTRTYLGIYIVLLIASLLNAMQEMHKLNIIESRYMRSIIWLSFISASIIALPHFSFEMLSIVAISGGLITSAFLQRLRSRKWQEMITLGFFAATLYIQWKMKFL